MAYLQNIGTTETRTVNPFVKVLEDIPGGVGIAIADVTQTIIAAGTPVGKDSNGLYHVVKTATAQANAANNATAYKVLKGHNFKVGDFFTTGTSKIAYAITSITTTNASYDTINVGTTLGVAVTAGDIYIEALAEATGDTSAFKYTPVGLLITDVEVMASASNIGQVARRATVKEALIAPIHANIKSAIPSIIFI